MIKFQRVKPGHYVCEAFDTTYKIHRWNPETGARILWCVSIDNVGMDDYRTLQQAKKHILADIEKVSAGKSSAE